MKGLPDSAAWFYDQAIQISDQIKDNRNCKVQLYSLLSRVSQMKGQPEKALEVIRLARPYMDQHTPEPLQVNYYYFTSQYFRLLSRFDSSVYYLQCAEKINNAFNPYGNWYVFNGMAELFHTENNYEKAEEYYLKAYTLTKERGVRMDHGLMINRLGNLYVNRKDTKKFAAILQEYERFMKNGKRDFGKDPVHSLLFLKWGNIDLEEKVNFLKSVRDEHVKNNYFQAAALANYHISSIYESADKPEEALKYLYENRDFLISKTALKESFTNLKYIYNLELKTGNTSNALLTANQLLELNMKLAEMTNKELVMEMETKYETEKKEKEIEMLSVRQKLTRLELIRAAENQRSLEEQNIMKDSALVQQHKLFVMAEQQQQLQQNELEKEKELSTSLYRENELKQQLLNEAASRKRLMLAGISLLTGAGFLIYFLYRRQLAKNSIIDRQRKDLEILNREIHHRVKNNLQVISSLLDMQSATADDERTAEKFLEGSQRVQSMAYIHQNLYQGNSVDSIDVRQYIISLTSNLKQSYNAGNITLKTDVEALNLHADTVIPLGMIINELVTNALKYAFEKSQQGEIQIVLKKLNEKLLLRVSDNGAGIPEQIDVTDGNSFGYKIINAFTQKLKALLTINRENGTDVQLLISKFRTA